MLRENSVIPRYIRVPDAYAHSIWFVSSYRIEIQSSAVEVNIKEDNPFSDSLLWNRFIPISSC